MGAANLWCPSVAVASATATLAISKIVTLSRAGRDQPLVCLTRRGGWPDPELALERRKTRVEYGGGARAIPARVVKPEQKAVRILTQWFVVEQRLGVANRLGMFTPTSQTRRESLEGVQVEPTAAIAVLADPLVVTGREEIPAIQLDGRAK